MVESILNSKQKYEFIIENANDLILIYNENLQIEFINQNACFLITGYKREEVTGKHIKDFLHPEDLDHIKSALNNAFLKINGLKTIRIKNKSGNYIWMEGNANSFLDTDGKSKILIISRDITNRKKMELEIEKSKNNFKSLTQNIPGMVYRGKPDWNTEILSNSEQICGYYPEEFNNKFINWLDLIHPDDKQRIIEEASILNEKPTNIKQFYRIIDKSGIIRWISDHKSSIFYNGEYLGVDGVVFDITYEKEIELDLIKSEKKYRNFIENFSGIVFKGKKDFSAEFIHGAIEELIGYTENDFLSNKINFSELIHPDDLLKVKASVDEFSQNSENKLQREYRIIDKNGKIHWILENIQKFFDVSLKENVVYGTLLDITDRKLTEEKLRKSEEDYRLLIENSANIIYRTNEFGKITFISGNVQNIFGIPSEEIKGMFITDFFDLLPLVNSKNQKKQIIKDFSEAFNQKQNDFKFTFEVNRLIKKVYLATCRLIWNHKAGMLLESVGIISDITEIYQLQENLKQSEEKYRLLVENSMEGIWALDQEGNTSFVNNAMADMFGYSKNEMIGKHLFYFMNEEWKQVAIEKLNGRKEGKKEKHEFQFLRKNGSLFYTQLSASPLFNQNGEYIGTLALVIDISEQKKATQALLDSELKYRHLSNELQLILDHLPALVFYKDTKNNFIWVNKFVANAHLMKKEEMQNLNMLQLYPEEDALKYWNDDLEVIRSKMSKLNIEEIWKTKTGDRWVITSKIPYFDENNEVIGIIGLSMDITERKIIEQKLKDSELMFRSLAENSLLGIVMIQDFQIIYLNKRFSEIVEIPRENLRNHFTNEFYQYIHEEDRGWAIELLKNRLEGKEDVPNNYNIRFITKNGNLKWFQVFANPIILQGKNTSLITYLDATEEKLNEMKLRESEEKFSAAFNNSPLMMGMISLDNGKFIEVNDALLKSFGYERYEVIGSKIDDLKIYYGDINRIELINQVKKNRYIQDLIGSIRLKNGKNRIIRLSASIFIIQNKEYLLFMMNDITEQKKIEQALIESESNMRNLLETAPIGIFELNLEPFPRLNFVNKKIIELTGYEIQEMKNKDFPNLIIHPDDVNSLMSEKSEKDIEFRIISKDNKIRWVSGSRLNVFEANKRVRIRFWLQDITDKKLAENALEKVQEELLEKRKFAAIGQLAAGIAHELNTPLANIDLTIHYLMKLNEQKIFDTKTIDQELTDIKNETQKCAQIVKDLLQFSRRIVISNEKLNIYNLLTSILESPAIARQIFLIGVNIQMKIDEQFEIIGDQALLFQAFQNILKNSLDALEEIKGKRTIDIEINRIQNDLHILIKDNGIGISQENLLKIFEPFFSTKKKGTGLGLSLCKGIIEKHGGSISITSQVGKGTLSKILLPIKNI
ncbi:MAG: PAS domain-containing sensor histidine kinase [Candidatus Lokiarchaeota archaeon]|nr:PAS domain-containing sensor histidine kinase [Candidatus Lokiarchaeota archaeon]